MPRCIYCDEEKSVEAFSDEHIWPNALGGDYLPHDVWRTDEVCQQCNNVSGLYVDADFIRSWIGKAEQSLNSDEYLAGAGKPQAIPLHFLGQLKNIPVPQDHVAEYWAGPCGAIIIFIRRDGGDATSAAYAGGDPRDKAGRVYMALTSDVDFWIRVSLESFHKHFKRFKRFIVNADISSDPRSNLPDLTDPVQIEDMKTVEAVIEISRAGKYLKVRPVIKFDAGNRMLAKLGLAIGCKLLGQEFLDSDYSKVLRHGFFEANSEKRQSIPIRGSGFLTSVGMQGVEGLLSWPGGWVLMLTVVNGLLGLLVVSPMGKTASVVVCDDFELTAKLDKPYLEGVVWVTVPVAQDAVGPISVGEYLAHQMKEQTHPALIALEGRRGDPSKLPNM